MYMLCIVCQVDVIAYSLLVLYLQKYSTLNKKIVFFFSPGRTVLRTDGVLLGKYDIINRDP